MSKELDVKIDATRNRLIKASQTKVGMGNYQQLRREYEEVILALTNAVDAINAEIGKEGDR